jgi:O-antigen ligase
MLSGTSMSADRRASFLEGALFVLGAIAVSGFILVPKSGLLVLIGCLTLWFVVVAGEALRGRFDGILLWWAAAFPLGYYFLSFPREHPIVALDRVVILIVFSGLFLVKPSTLTATPRALRRAGFVWLAFIAVAGVSLEKSPDLVTSARVLLDGFLLPVLLGWCIIARFDVRRRLPTIHTAVVISSIICAAVAAAEMVTGQDLLPNGNSEMFHAGSIPRPNGPFASNDSLALIGGISIFVLLFLRASLGPRLSVGRRVLHSIGLTAAIGMALMPLFRSVMITLLLALIIDTFWEPKTPRRAWRVVLLLASVGLIFISSVFAPDMFEDRSRGENVYGRVAQYEQNVQVFLDHPVLGVGFSNYHNFVVGEPRYLESYKGVSSLDSPHSNLAAVLSETGIVGFVPYVMAHVLLLVAACQLRRWSGSGHRVWKYCLYMFLTYWISGLSLAAGYEAPLNLWYVFAMTVSYKYALTDPELLQPAAVQMPYEACSRPTSSTVFAR